MYIENDGSSLRKSLIIQLRVIYALLLREVITRYGRHNIGFLWLFVEPMLFTIGVTTLWTFLKMGGHGGSISIAAVALTGYSSILLWRNCSNRAVKSVEANLALLYHRNVRVLDVFFARSLLEIAGATVSLIVLTILFSFLNLMSLPNDFLRVLLGWILLAWFAIALALVVGALSELSELVDRVWHVLTYLLFPLSGAAFFVDWFPDNIKNLLYWLPMVHATEMIRHGFFGSAVRTYEDPVYFAIFNMSLTFIGLILVRRVSQRVEPE